MPRHNPFQQATKQQLKARLALAGPTGAGKTWTALEWARVLAGDDGRVAVLDTERGSASLYSDRFEFDTLRMAPPYDPAIACEHLRAAESHGYGVVVIDSLTHFWQGEGGTLDIKDSAAQRMGGNDYAGWAIATPALRHLIDVMLGLDAHLIATMRSKMAYVLDGDNRPQKVGMAPVMRDGVEYEFTLVGDIDLEHRIAISKSRCPALADKMIQPNRAGEAAETFLDWLATGEPTAPRAAVNALVDRINDLASAARKQCKTRVVEEVGPPESYTVDQLAKATAIVDEMEAHTIDDEDEDGDQPTLTAVDDDEGEAA